MPVQADAFFSLIDRADDMGMIIAAGGLINPQITVFEVLAQAVADEIAVFRVDDGKFLIGHGFAP